MKMRAPSARATKMRANALFSASVSFVCKMAEMENEVARLTAENEELKALLAARDAEIAQLKRNLKLAHEMMKEGELEDVNEDPNEERRRLAAAAAAVGAPPDYNPFIHPDDYDRDAPPPRIFTKTFSTEGNE